MKKRFLNLMSAVLVLILMLTVFCSAAVFAIEERTVLGVTNFVDNDGTTSVVIDDEDIIWLYEESYDAAAWYGIDNSSGMFRPGSRFWVKNINKDSDPEEFDQVVSQIDSSGNFKASHNNGVVLVGVTDPDGNEYNRLAEITNLYVQLGDDWDAEDIKAEFVSEGSEENVPVEYKNMKCPEGNTAFVKVGVSHLGEPLIMFEKQPLFASVISQYQPFLAIALVLVIIAVLVLVIRAKKRRQNGNGQ